MKSLRRATLALLIAALSAWSIPLAAEQKPEAQKTEAPAPPQPKGRRLTEDENVKLQLMQSQFENFARSLCESIVVKFDNCSVGNGVVMERPAAPAKPEAPKAEAAKPAEKK